MPTLIFVTFGDHDTHTSEIHFVKASGGLDLGRLPRCAEIYKLVRLKYHHRAATILFTNLHNAPNRFSTMKLVSKKVCHD